MDNNQPNNQNPNARPSNPQPSPLSRPKPIGQSVPPVGQSMRRNGAFGGEPPQEKKGWKSIGIVGFLTIVGIKILAKLAVVGVATTAHTTVSKYESWSKEFKTEFTSGCSEEAVKSIREKAGNRIAPEQVNQMATQYCECLTDKIESAHIVSTEYNTLTDSQESATRKQVAEVNTYMASAEGKAALQTCGDKAAQLASAPLPVNAN